MRRAVRALALRMPTLLACLAISLVARALAPRATAASQAIPIDFGLQSSILSASSVSPVMDLKRDLTRPQTTTALTYRTDSSGPLYLKLAVLDNLSDDTWLLAASGADAASWNPGRCSAGHRRPTPRAGPAALAGDSRRAASPSRPRSGRPDAHLRAGARTPRTDPRRRQWPPARYAKRPWIQALASRASGTRGAATGPRTRRRPPR